MVPPVGLMTVFTTFLARFGRPGLCLADFPGRWLALPAAGACDPRTLPVLDGEPADFDHDAERFRDEAEVAAAARHVGDLVLVYAHEVRGADLYVRDAPASSDMGEAQAPVPGLPDKALLVGVMPPSGTTGVAGLVTLDAAGITHASSGVFPLVMAPRRPSR